MALRKLRRGKTLSTIAAISLFILMFFHWFGVKAVNTSNLLFAISSNEPGKSAWEALDFIPVVLMVTILATLLATALCLMDRGGRWRRIASAMVGILGTVSSLLILSRIIDPPTFNVEATITDEGVVQLPVVLALIAAGGIALGGFLSLWEELRAERSVNPPTRSANG